MTTTTAPSPAGTGSPGMAPEEKKAAVFTVGGALLIGGPMAAICVMLAVGIEQAFAKSGWDKPDWLNGRTPPTAEQIAEHQRQLADRRRRLAAEAEEYFAQARERAKVRAALLEEHRQNLRNWIGNSREGDKPQRPDGAVRSPWEFLQNTVATARAGYRRLDQKMAEGDRRILAALPAIGEFFRELGRFVSGFVEGTREGWRLYQQAKNPAGEQEAGAEPATISPAEPGTPIKTPLTGPAVQPAPAGGPAPGLTPGGATPGLTPGTGQQPATSAGPEPGRLSTGPADPRAGTVEGDVMTADGAVALPGRQAGQGETNLDQILEAFIDLPQLLHSVRQQVPDLRIAQLQIQQRLDWILALCTMYGAPDAVWHFLAETGEVTRALATGLKAIEVHNEVASELAEQALAGLRPAQDDLHVVHAQGASGEMFAAAAETAA
jgi:hypothetical protein